MNSACLYVVATPIGNLEDITLRALRVLAEADIVAAEDTRHSRVLLSHHGIERQLLALHRDRGRKSRHARSLVLEKSAKLQQRIDQLRAMQAVLDDMASRCHGDEGPECAILDDLAGVEDKVQ